MSSSMQALNISIFRIIALLAISLDVGIVNVLFFMQFSAFASRFQHSRIRALELIFRARRSLPP